MSRRFRDERVRAATRALAPTTRSIRHVALAITSGLLLAAPSTAFGAAKGIETDITWDVDSATQTQDANAMSDLGVSWTRIILSWHDVETSQGNYSSKKLAEIDNAVSLARARGINIDMVVYESPQWASGTTNKNAPPQNPQDYANFIHAMVQRYPGVAAWEVWNEENLPRFWNGSANPGAYANLLRAAYPAVKSANGNALVLFGGMSNADYQFLSDVYAAAPDIGNYYDVMAEHPYPGGDSPDLATYDSSGHLARNSFPGYRSVRQVMLDHGTDKPMWFTEMGWSTTTQAGGVSPQQQADYIRLAYACMNNDPYIQVAMVYELRNNYWANNADDWEDRLGLVATDWSQKPAYDAFKTTDPGATGCVYHTGDGRPIDGQQQASATTASASSATTTTTTTTRKTSSRRTRKPKIVLKFKGRGAHGAHSAGAGSKRQTAANLTVAGRVLNAHGGSVVMVFQLRVGHGKWKLGQAVRMTLGRHGVFQTRKPIALPAGGWRTQASYGRAVKSRFLYFHL